MVFHCCFFIFINLNSAIEVFDGRTRESKFLCLLMHNNAVLLFLNAKTRRKNNEKIITIRHYFVSHILIIYIHLRLKTK